MKFSCRHPAKPSTSSRENVVFVRNLLQNLQDHSFSCETSFTICKLKMWKRSFHARHPSRTPSWRCDKRDENYISTLWHFWPSFLWHLSSDISCLWHFSFLTCLSCGISFLWHFSFLTSSSSGISFLWHLALLASPSVILKVHNMEVSHPSFFWQSKLESTARHKPSQKASPPQGPLHHTSCAPQECFTRMLRSVRQACCVLWGRQCRCKKTMTCFCWNKACFNIFHWKAWHQ